MQHRHEERVEQRDYMEPVLVERRDEHLLPRPAVSISPALCLLHND